MPELPEVEAARRVIERATRGKEVASLRLVHPALERCMTPAERAAVAGRRVMRVERRGKHQLLHLDDGSVLHVHFRMAGDWAVGREDDPVPPHARALLSFRDGTRVALVDPRALCTVTLHESAAAALPALGPEATDPALSAGALHAALARRRVAIKVALLDQRVVAGLGNIYAAEALWRARIDPRTPASSISRARLGRLIDGMRATLDAAERDPGRYGGRESPARFQVYGREGEPCPRCGARIRRIVQGGRSTYYCARCQR
ncbi:MAG: bifunctional DNA-formamidopyrimidine glycosylase/DNA-(apurinic or apyrimidinic site) lyase [Gemmatimonadaceae bacterium]